MSNHDYRALCEQLMELAEGKRYDGSAVIAKARAALAQPEPVAPTDEELIEMWHSSDWFNEGATPREFISIARAALARWGTPANNTRGTH
jgi:hypothetical protein